MKKLLALTGIRGVAALWVVLYHFRGLFDYGILSPLFLRGYLGVDLFFILSGFVISYVHQHEFAVVTGANTLRFMILRCARILPVHYCMLLLFVIFFVCKGLAMHESFPFKTDGTAWDFVLNLLNVQSWGFADHPSWNKVSWSVSAEWFAYLTFPLTAPLVQRIKSIPLNILLILLCFGALAGFSVAVGAENLNWTFQNGLIRVSTEFLAGCALYNIFKQTEGQQAGFWLMLALVTLLSGFFLHLPDVPLVMLFVPILYGLSKGGGWVSRLLATPWMLHLGEISFSMYMVHVFITDRFTYFEENKLHWITAEPSVQGFVVFTVLLLTMVGAAQLLYRLVEVPSRNGIRALFLKEGHLKKNDHKTQPVSVSITTEALGAGS